MRVLTRREELLLQARRQPAAVVDQLLAAEQRVQTLKQQVQALQAQAALNSTNSGKPPSCDGLAKPPVSRSLREKTGRKPGGQPGHPGHTLQPVAKPDHLAVHSLGRCPCMARTFAGSPSICSTSSCCPSTGCARSVWTSLASP